MARLIVISPFFLALMAQAVSAQPPAQTPEQAVSAMSMLGFGVVPTDLSLVTVFQAPVVQAELKLTEDQKTRSKQFWTFHAAEIKKVLQEYQRSRKELGATPDKEHAAELRNQLDSALGALHKKAEDWLGKLLDRGQMARLREIWMQAEGWAAFRRQEVRDWLNLSPEQCQSIEEIDMNGMLRLREVTTVSAKVDPFSDKLTPAESAKQLQSKSFKGTVAAAQAGAMKVRGETMQAIAKVLSKKQREKYLKRLGEPFDFTKPLKERPLTKEGKE